MRKETELSEVEWDKLENDCKYIRKDCDEDLDDLIYEHKTEKRYFRVCVTRDSSCWVVCIFESDEPY